MGFWKMVRRGVILDTRILGVRKVPISSTIDMQRSFLTTCDGPSTHKGSNRLDPSLVDAL